MLENETINKKKKKREKQKMRQKNKHAIITRIISQILWFNWISIKLNIYMIAFSLNWKPIYQCLLATTKTNNKTKKKSSHQKKSGGRVEAA